MSIEDFVEIKFSHPGMFTTVRETLTRIGMASLAKRTVYQTAHIFQKQGKYYIVHFKQLLRLDGKEDATLSAGDMVRLRAIITRLSDWGMIEVVSAGFQPATLGSTGLTFVKFSDKASWTFEPKYKIGKGKRYAKGEPIEHV